MYNIRIFYHCNLGNNLIKTNTIDQQLSYIPSVDEMQPVVNSFVSKIKGKDIVLNHEGVITDDKSISYEFLSQEGDHVFVDILK